MDMMHESRFEVQQQYRSQRGMDPRPGDDVLQLAFRFGRLVGLSDNQQAAATGAISVRDSAASAALCSPALASTAYIDRPPFAIGSVSGLPVESRYSSVWI